VAINGHNGGHFSHNGEKEVGEGEEMAAAVSDVEEARGRGSGSGSERLGWLGCLAGVARARRARGAAQGYGSASREEEEPWGRGRPTRR
jgi:hypothetical protein